MNVKICALHDGISVGANGASHQCCEDFALMPSIPGTVIYPADDVEARQVVKAVYDLQDPVYVRFSRAAKLLVEKNPAQVKWLGLNEIFGHSGTPVELMREFELDALNLRTVHEHFGR